MNRDFSFGWLFLVITLGVASGNLISNWVTAKVATYQFQIAVEQAQSELKAQMAKLRSKSDAQSTVAAAQRTQEAEKMRKMRMGSRTGQDLSRKCTEWTRAAAHTPTATTQAEATKACRHYESYLARGVWDAER